MGNPIYLAIYFLLTGMQNDWIAESLKIRYQGKKENKNVAKIRYVPLLIPIAFIVSPKFYSITLTQ